MRMLSVRALSNTLLRNKRKTAVLLLYALATVLVVGLRARHYAGAPTWLVPVARGAAAGIYLNFALVLLPMMRLVLSRRSVGFLRVLLPFHKAVEAHVITGAAILGFSVIHVLAYAGLYLFAHDVYVAAAYPRAVVTGVLLCGLLAALAWGAVVRTRGTFEVFYLTHMLTIPITVLAVIHAPWMLAVIAVPFAAYLLDRLVRLFFMTRRAEVVQIEVGERDLDLVIHRPEAFEYRAGDYAFLCVPSISRLQWHPFSLINAQTDTSDLRFRIRMYGSWTRALARVPPGTLIHVDGPFASPSRDLFGAPRVVVVAGGIGITPFVSCLEEACRSGPWFEAFHLYWLERDQASFARFLPLLEQLERQHGAVMRVTLVAATASAQPGRLERRGPIDWTAELAALHDGGLHDATLFFCGPRPLSGALRLATREVGYAFRTESF